MSLKRFLIISFVLVAILPVSIVGIISLQILSSQMQQAVEESNLLISKSLTGEIELLLSKPVILLNQVKAVLEDGTLITPQQTDLYLEKAILNSNILERIKIIDKKGIVRHQAPYDRNFIGLNLSNQPYVSKPLKFGKRFWSNTLISLETGLPTITLSIPLSNGVLVGHLNLMSLNRIVEKVQIRTEGYAFVVDNMGVTIAHPDKKFITERRNLGYLKIIRQGLIGNLGTHLYLDSDIDHLGSVSRIEPTGWLVVVTVPTRLAFLSVNKIRNLIGLGSGGAFLLALIIAIFSIQKASKPMNQLIENAKSIAQGKYQEKLVTKGYTELNTLSDSFNMMVNAIKSRESDLKASEKKFRKMIEMAPYPMIITEKDLKINYLNQMFSDVFGYVIKDTRPQIPWWQNICPNESIRNSIEQGLNNEIDRKLPSQEFLYSSDWDLICKNGDIKQIEFKMVPIDKMFLIIISDLTERKRTEQLLIHSEKMESIGSMAAGMAHEINNPLSGIMQGAQNIKRRLQPDLAANQKDAKNTEVDLENLQKYLEARKIDSFLDFIIEGGSRAANIVKNMLQFSRKSNTVSEIADIHKTIEHSIELAKSDFNLEKKYDFKQLNIVRSFDNSIPLITCIPNELEQVLLNLLSNAAQAFSSDEIRDDRQIEIKTQNQGHWIQIEVIDNGPGIKPAIMKRIFEPFFTTKASGDGTGLGLSVAYMIVTKHHNGEMEVNSILDKGTSFTLRLPQNRDSLTV